MRRTRSARQSAAHEEALARRFALLEAEVAPVDGRPPPADPADPDGAPALPVPGRHAARRSRRAGVQATADPPAGGSADPPGAGALDALRDRLPLAGGEPGRWSLGPAQLSVVAVVAAVGLAVTAWWVVRSDPEPVPVSAEVGVTEVSPLLPGAVPSPVASAAPPGATAPPAPGSAQQVGGPAGEVVVHVAGEVRRPGLVVLPEGSRVADAVEAAGGARRGTDLTALNLARPLVDGEQVVVGDVPGAPGGPTAGTVGGAPVTGTGAATPLVDLNTADQALLETLPGVGPVTATAILEWRAEHGGFTAVDELLEVDGIGEATLADLAPLVTV